MKGKKTIFTYLFTMLNKIDNVSNFLSGCEVNHELPSERDHWHS